MEGICGVSLEFNMFLCWQCNNSSKASSVPTQNLFYLPGLTYRFVYDLDEVYIISFSIRKPTTRGKVV